MATRGYATVEGFTRRGQVILEVDACALDVVTKARAKDQLIEIRSIKPKNPPRPLTLAGGGA